MQNNESGDTAQSPQADIHTRRDWREERREMHREWREARHRFPYHGLFWGLTLVLLGTIFLLDQAGWISGETWWQSLLIGLGVIWIINGITHYRSPAYRWGSYGKFVFGVILILIGTIFILGFGSWWPLALIVAGAALLLRFFWR
jgi:hypothetical protein